MTREEALKKAINIVAYFEAHFAKSKEAREDAANIIEALEQEPNKEAYNQGYEDGYLAGQKNIAERCKNAIHEAYMNAYDEQSLVRDLTQAVNELPFVNPQKEGEYIKSAIRISKNIPKEMAEKVFFDTQEKEINEDDSRHREKIPHEVSEVICLKCLHRWIAVYPEETQLKHLECKCGEVGYVIKTGQTLDVLEGEGE